MVVVIKKHKLAYFSVPKIACTSIKHLLHEIKTGKRFEPFTRPNGRRVFVHTLYPSDPFDSVDPTAFDGFQRITVVRDPVKRLLSAYTNRVLHYRELSAERVSAKLDAAGLPSDPDLDTFINHLDGYCETIGSIRHHTLPHTHFLGHDPAFFTRIYRFSELGQLQADIRDLTGTNVPLMHMQKGGPKLSASDLTAAQIATIRARYADDYRAFGAYLD